jgi:hypothetical protein
VRWTRQTAVLRGLISKDEPSVWRLTETANAKLGNIVRGSILTFAISENGAFLWANAEDAVGMIEKGSIQCIISSPPYPLLCPKAYGNVPPSLYVDWLTRLFQMWLPPSDDRWVIPVQHRTRFQGGLRFAAVAHRATSHQVGGRAWDSPPPAPLLAQSNQDASASMGRHPTAARDAIS